MQSENVLSKGLLYGVLLGSTLVSLFGIALLIAMGLLGYSGLGSATPISVICLLTPYWLVKFSDLTLIYKLIFAHCLISVVASIALTALLFSLAFKAWKGEVVRVWTLMVVLLYISASLTVYGAIIPGGYFLTFYKQVGNCMLASYDSTQLTALAICYILLVVLALIVWIILFFLYWKSTDPHDKYREVTNSQAEPQEQPQPYQEHPPHQPPPQQQPQEYLLKSHPKREQQFIHEETKENLISEPRTINYVYSQVLDGQQQPGSPKQADKEPMNYLPQESRNRKRDIMPILEAKQNYRREDPSQVHETPSSYPYGRSPPRSYVRDEHRQSPEKSKYMNSLLHESKQYLSRQGPSSILSSQGLQQRQAKGADRFRAGNDHPMRIRRSPDRQGVLLNYIRGKYAG